MIQYCNYPIFVNVFKCHFIICTIICVFVCSPGSGTVVNADLDFNNEAGISADAVKNTLALAASELDLPIAVNVSSINVIGV